jgi:hypothetical protein
MTYSTTISIYRRRNHTVRVVVDLTALVDITGAILTLSVRQGSVQAGGGAIVLAKTNQGGDATQAAVVAVDTVEFYIVPSDTYPLSPGSYTCDATIETGLGRFQLLAPLSFTVLEPVTL